MKSIAASLFVLLSVAAGPALAQADTYPSRTVKIVVPFTPGGSPDAVARAVSPGLGQAWKQPVVVENKAGAGGNIGGETVARAPSDGYTLLLSGSGLACINPKLYTKTSFDLVNDLKLVTPLGFVPIVLVVHPAIPARTLSELVAHARSLPGGLTYGSGGVGTPQHLSGEMFTLYTGLKMTHVPYKGNGPALADLMAGQTDIMFSPINSVAPLIKAGKVRAIAAAGSQRMPAMPDLPTIAEAGVAGYDSSLWLAMAVPSATPKDVVDKLDRDVRSVLGRGDVKASLAQQGIEQLAGSPADFQDMVRKDCARWAKVIADARISAD